MAGEGGVDNKLEVFVVVEAFGVFGALTPFDIDDAEFVAALEEEVDDAFDGLVGDGAVEFDFATDDSPFILLDGIDEGDGGGAEFGDECGAFGFFAIHLECSAFGVYVFEDVVIVPVGGEGGSPANCGVFEEGKEFVE